MPRFPTCSSFARYSGWDRRCAQASSFPSVSSSRAADWGPRCAVGGASFLTRRRVLRGLTRKTHASERQRTSVCDPASRRPASSASHPWLRQCPSRSTKRSRVTPTGTQRNALPCAGDKTALQMLLPPSQAESSVSAGCSSGSSTATWFVLEQPSKAATRTCNRNLVRHRLLRSYQAASMGPSPSQRGDC